MKFQSLLILLCFTSAHGRRQQEKFADETYNDSYNSDESDPTSPLAKQQLHEQSSNATTEQTQQHNSTTHKAHWSALAQQTRDTDQQAFAQLSIQDQAQAYTPYKEINLTKKAHSKLINTQSKYHVRFRPFFKQNNNMQIRNLTYEGLQEEMREENKQNLTFDEFLHYKRAFYLSGNYTSEQEDNKLVDEYWTKPKSLVEKEQPLQIDRINQDKMVTVHLIAHSHNDAGWRKTVDEYFSGSNKGSDSGSVKTIYDGVADELQRDPKRKFTIVDMKFFNMWYTKLNNDKKKQVKNLIQNGQLEITQGGWVSTDEACPNYEDMILNMQIGHSFLQKEFGVRPRIGWMIDAFGHSAANAALFSDFGFDAVFLGREPNESRERREMNSELQFIWKPLSKHYGDSKEIFAHMFNAHYTAPDETLHNDIDRTTDESIQSDKTLSNYNAQKAAVKLINHVQELTKHYPAKLNIMVLVGDDFAYPDAFDTFKETDDLVELINQINQKNMTFQYSTPSQFIDAVNKEKVVWPVFEDDFYPYYEKRYEFWTGYYTTRPGMKKQAKSYTQLFHAESRLFARRVINQDTSNSQIDSAMSAYWKSMDQLAVMQHHDAITGTSLGYVATAYSHNLYQGFQDSKQQMSEDLSKKVKQLANIDVKSQGLGQCHDFMQNDTVVNCPVNDADSKEFLVVVYNQNTQKKEHLTRLLLPNPNYRAQVWDQKAAQFIDTEFDIFQQKHWKKDGGGYEDNVMYLKASIDVDQIALVKLIKTDSANLAGEPVPDAAKKEKSLTLQGVSDNYITFQYVNKAQGLKQSFGVNLKQYFGAKLHNMTNLQQSSDHTRDYLQYNEIEMLDSQNAEGVYIFQPAWDDPQPHQYSQINDDAYYQNGKLVEQWTFDFTDPQSTEKAKMRVRFSEHFDEFIEFDVELNPLPIDDGKDKDVTVNFKMLNGFDPQGQFWSDQNGLEMQEHHIENLPSNYTFLNDKPYPNYKMVAGNFVPVETAIMMRDNNQSNIQVTVMNDRSQAGTADLTDKATIELMQQRRGLLDDQKGLCEALNETEQADQRPPRVNARYFMQIFDYEKADSKLRSQQINLQQPLQYFFATDKNFHQVPLPAANKNNATSLASLISQFKLPQGVTYRMFPVAKNMVQIRFDNLADLVDATAESAKTQYINVEQFADDLFFDENKLRASNFEVQEMSLQGVYPLDQGKRKEWFTAEGKLSRLHVLAQNENGFKGVALEPQRMRTFQIAYNQPEDSLKATIAQKEITKKKAAGALHQFAIRDMIMVNQHKYNY